MRKLLSAVVITLSLGVAATSCGQEADVSSSQNTNASAQTMEDGLAAYEAAYSSRDYSTALSIFQSLADQGNASAQYRLGAMYANARGVQQDDAEAVRWFRLAADQGHAEAQYYLGLMYANGEGVPQDYAEALRLYRLSADQGNWAARNRANALAPTP